MTRDELAAFDEGVLDAVAADHAVESARLTELVRTHQANVRDLPGVEDIVYEWRSQFHQDPLLSRTEREYVLALRDHVWNEFAQSLSLSEAEMAALRALHERVAATVLDGEADIDGVMVLVRP